MNCVFIKKVEEKERRVVDGKLFRLLHKSERLESIIAELDIGVESDRYRHKGEEVHMVLKGEIEYEVGDNVYHMEEGDTLWHPSNIPHRARNVGQDKAIYLTVSTPPTFI
ncbi:MAG: cupin domain-containing protein [Thermoplasmata archaeon]